MTEAAALAELRAALVGVRGCVIVKEGLRCSACEARAVIVTLDAWPYGTQPYVSRECAVCRTASSRPAHPQEAP
jgi:hypothetical protein